MTVLIYAQGLCETTLQNIGFTGTEHVITAITTPSAQAVTNYQRYEFLGDSVLKFTVSCQLFFQHPNWHEGYLSQGRDDIVQNPRLARAALDLGLDSFIISKQFSPRKWSAPLISEKITQVASRRTMSTKVLADIVESLIGAAYLDGGHEKAQACIHFFLPEVNMTAPANVSLTSCAVSKNDRHMINDLLEEQVGYSFRNRSLLLEALTHPSCQHDASTQSYQRLEFLGDAVLDMVIVSTIFKHAIEIPQGEMTMIKHAMVNANLLAFLCMEFAMEQESINVEQTPSGGFAIKSDKEYVELWRFMRCEGINLRTAQERAISRYHLLREEISLYLHQGNHYPWQALSQLNADKLFSDIIESVIGAIFVDSLGNLVECEMFAERIGLLPYLRRILAGGINVAHPMNIAQQMSKGNVQFSVKRIQVENGDASYQCAVTLDGHEAVVVEGCLSREEAEVKAANGAIEILMQLAATTTSEQ
ncbi:hypothetical protein EYZ11_001354 [Aspergillus tanneri]|uniref:RNase III domain-containing protein n=1 Tax=Aspergillus tanneri TaxID=1220188 RepID=A0A4S3JUU1_9EURO|nr:hypothetical protein EYZ11_001354 [Aspergillus tanneri]